MAPAPRHLAIIPDGNRRWARARGLGAPEGHRAGIRRIGHIAEAAWEKGVETFTFWWGSPANLTKRSPEEVEVITDALRDWARSDLPSILGRHGASFEAIGRWRELCPGIAPGIEAAARAAGTGPRRMVLLMAYDGREEILAAAAVPRARAGGVEAFGRTLWTGHLPAVDLVIRTGGGAHLSAGFLLWSIAEAQLAFLDPCWPDMTTELLDRCFAAFGATERRFGR